MATSAELKQNILNGGYDQAFAKLYGADTLLWQPSVSVMWI